MIDLNILVIAAGLPTSSFNDGVLNPILDAAAAALPALFMLMPLFVALSDAAAIISGAKPLVMVSGNFSISFWRKLGRELNVFVAAGRRWSTATRGRRRPWARR